MNEPVDAQYKPLAVKEETPPPQLFSAMSPAQRLQVATEVATVLKGVLTKGKIGIDARGNPKRIPLIVRVPQKNKAGDIIGYSEHVEVEGWTTCAMLANCTIPVRWTKPLESGKGFTAFAEVINVNTGQVVGAGEGQCDRSEKRWAYADDYAIKSMAQTRAQSKAARTVFAWIMVLAGFAATPAPEMPPETQADDDREPPPPPPPKEENPEYRRKVGMGVIAKLQKEKDAEGNLVIPDADYREILVREFGPQRFTDPTTGECKPTKYVLKIDEIERLYLALVAEIKQRKKPRLVNE